MFCSRYNFSLKNNARFGNIAQILAYFLEATLQLFHGNGSCLKSFNKETLWPIGLPDKFLLQITKVEVTEKHIRNEARMNT